MNLHQQRMHFYCRETQRQEIISSRAYFLWQHAGRPVERDLEFWLAAERQVEGWLRFLPG